LINQLVDQLIPELAGTRPADPAKTKSAPASAAALQMLEPPRPLAQVPLRLMPAGPVVNELGVGLLMTVTLSNSRKNEFAIPEPVTGLS